MCTYDALALVGIALRVEFNKRGNCNPMAPLPGEALYSSYKSKNATLVTDGSANVQLSL